MIENPRLRRGFEWDASMSITVFEELAQRYDAWYEGAVGQVAFPMEVECLRPLLLGPPTPHLEVGVGTGRFAEALQVEVGIDPSCSMLRLACQRGVSVVQGVGERLPFPDEAFGAVLLVVTLCFVDDPLVVLRESARVVCSDGAVVLGLVLRESPWAEAYLEKGLRGHPFYAAAHFYRLREVEEMLEAVGLSVRRHRSVLCQAPSEIPSREPPLEGYVPEAGFTCLLAYKTHRKQRENREEIYEDSYR